jgi:hypothetical protein
MSKKGRWIISGVALALFSLAMAILVGAKVGISMAKKPMPPPPLEATTSTVVKTGVISTTAIITSTSLVPFLVLPNATTVTVWTEPIIVMEPTVNIRPTPPGMTPKPEEPPKMCLPNGQYESKEICEGQCHAKSGETAKCDVGAFEKDTKVAWTCISCPA